MVVKWNKQKIIKKIRERNSTGKPLNYQAVVNDDEKLAGAARRYFGSWDDALIAAGFNPEEIKFPDIERKPRGTWTKAKILADIRRDWEAGKDLSAHATQKRSSSLVAQGQQLFGSWGEALEAAGIPIEENMKVILWDKNRIIKKIKDIHQNNGLLNRLNAEAWNPALVQSAVNYFGSWDKAVKAAGIDPIETRKTIKWSKNKVLSEIAKGRNNKTIYETALKYFNSWQEAKRAAGFPNEDSSYNISNNIRKYRKKAGLSQTELGRKIGYTHRTISMLELNQYKNPRISLVLKLAEALNCSIADLYELNKGGDNH